MSKITKADKENTNEEVSMSEVKTESKPMSKGNKILTGLHLVLNISIMLTLFGKFEVVHSSNIPVPSQATIFLQFILLMSFLTGETITCVKKLIKKK